MKVKYIWSCEQLPNWMTDEEMERKRMYYENKYTIIEKHWRCLLPKSLCFCNEINQDTLFFNAHLKYHHD